MKKQSTKQTNSEREHMNEQKQHKQILLVFQDTSRPTPSQTCYAAKSYNVSTYFSDIDCCKKMLNLVAICTEVKY